MKTILLVSPYWKEDHRWMVSSFKLARLWSSLGYKVEAVAMHSTNGVLQESENLRVHLVKDLFLKDPFNYGISFGVWKKILQLRKELKPDHIVFNKPLFWPTLMLPVLRLMGEKPILLSDVLGGMTWWPRNLFPKILMGILGWTQGLLVMWSASKIVFFHPQPESLLKKLMIWKKSRVIPTGIDASLYGRNKEGTDIKITYTGRLESVKGADDFLAAVRPVVTEDYNIRAQVAGLVKEGDPLAAQYTDCVQFLGLRDDIPAILSETDIFVMPSYSEGLSNSVMEAMASGCACIVSNVGGNKYLVQDGESGLTFTPGDREALQGLIRQLIAYPEQREAYGRAARQRILDHFDWPMVGQMYRNLFENEQ